MIQTALLFNVPYKEIREKLQVTERQIHYAKRCRLTPQKARKHQPKLNTLQKTRLRDWLLSSPSHRRTPYYQIPRYLLELNAGEAAIRTAFRELGYCRVSKKKGFSDEPRVMRDRKAFAEQGIT